MREVARRRVLLVVVQAVRVDPVRAGHAEPLRFGVHARGEGLLRAGDALADRGGDVVGRLDHDDLQRVVERQHRARLVAHLARRLVGGVLATCGPATAASPRRPGRRGTRHRSSSAWSARPDTSASNGSSLSITWPVLASNSIDGPALRRTDASSRQRPVPAMPRRKMRRIDEPASCPCLRRTSARLDALECAGAPLAQRRHVAFACYLAYVTSRWQKARARATAPHRPNQTGKLECRF